VPLLRNQACRPLARGMVDPQIELRAGAAGQSRANLSLIYCIEISARLTNGKSRAFQGQQSCRLLNSDFEGREGFLALNEMLPRVSVEKDGRRLGSNSCQSSTRGCAKRLRRQEVKINDDVARKLRKLCYPQHSLSHLIRQHQKRSVIARRNERCRPSRCASKVRSVWHWEKNRHEVTPLRSPPRRMTRETHGQAIERQPEGRVEPLARALLARRK
jgi:hypothetical protein